ncbi:MAG: alpha/beta hydrolase [Polyangiaceae bacterium]
MPFTLSTDGTRIHYQVIEPAVASTRPPVVLVQGLGLSSHFWFDLPRRLAAHADAPRRVIVLDNRGTGDSDAPRGTYRMSAMADDVAAVIDAAGSEPAVVVGISMGGMIAQHVALRHPTRVAGLVLLATSPGLPHARLPGPFALALLVLAPFAKDPFYALDRILLPSTHLHRARELLSDWPAAFESNRVGGRAFVAQFMAAALHSSGARLRTIRCPVVVVTGSDDIVVPPKNSEILARLIPHAILEILPGVGHGVPILDEAVVERALASLEKKPRPPSADDS